LHVVVTLLFTVAVCAVSVLAQPPEPAEARLFERVYLAKDDGAGKPGEETSEFAPGDIPIHCVVVLSGASTATVRMALIAVSVAGIDPEREIISTTYTTKEMQDRVFFNGRPSKLWFVGSYRADIYIDGTLVGKFPFIVKGAREAPKPAMNFQPKQPVKPRSATAKKT
jgi:hypothetical protein